MRSQLGLEEMRTGDSDDRLLSRGAGSARGTALLAKCGGLTAAVVGLGVPAPQMTALSPVRWLLLPCGLAAAPLSVCSLLGFVDSWVKPPCLTAYRAVMRTSSICDGSPCCPAALVISHRIINCPEIQCPGTAHTRRLSVSPRERVRGVAAPQDVSGGSHDVLSPTAVIGRLAWGGRVCGL